MTATVSGRATTPRRRMGLPGQIAAVLAPAALGGVAAVVLSADGPDVTLYADGSPASLAIVVGAALSLVVLIALLARSKAQVRQEGQTATVAEEAVRSDRRTFLMRLDHELKNPITAMRAALANISAMVDQSDGGLADAVASVDAQALRLSRLTADLRKIAEVEMQTIHLAPVDLAMLSEEVATAVEQTSGRPVKVIVHRAPTALQAAAGDEDLLFLAVHNLVANAAKFCRPEDAIEIRAFNSPPWVVVEVADTGPGIPADEMALVWEELGRSRNARGVPGSGLGLSLVRTIVNRHGGQIEMSSEEGRGTLFVVRLHPMNPNRTQQLDALVRPLD